MDAGCEALHPGTCFLAEHLGFHEAAANANVLVVGPPAPVVFRVVDRLALRKVAQAAGLPLIPASEPLSSGDDGLESAARIGTPLYVKAVHGRVLERVEDLAEVPAAVIRVQNVARAIAGDERVYLERVVDARRHVGAVIVGEEGSAPIVLGWVDSSAERGRFTHVEECGASVVSPFVAEQLTEQAVALCKAVGWSGVGRIRWALTPDGRAYLLGISARLTNGFELVEHMHGVDLVDTQVRLAMGERLAWEQPEQPASSHGIQLRLYHQSEDGSRPDGVLTRLELPSGEAVHSSRAVDVGTACSMDTEPLLATVTVVAPTRQTAVVLARAALEQVVVEGIPTNVERLVGLLRREDFWRGEHDARVLR